MPDFDRKKIMRQCFFSVPTVPRFVYEGKHVPGGDTMVATTVNIHREIVDLIQEEACRHRVTQKETIVNLLKMMMRDHDPSVYAIKTVKYQGDDSKERWHCFHIRFHEDEYEFFNDLRKVSKCSISLLIALAVKKYLLPQVDGSRVGVDNYIFIKHYIVGVEVIDGVICWHFYWGLPVDYLYGKTRATGGIQADYGNL